VAVLAAADVSEDFHAQYRAKGKSYSYTGSGTTPADRLWIAYRVCHVPVKLDIEKIRQAMPLLVGRRDFSAFVGRQAAVTRNPVRTLSDVTLDADGPRLTFRFQGDGFLYHMIRILTGTLVAIGQNKLTGQDLPAIIAAGDRARSGKTMPPQGLCLERVYYDPPLFDDFFFQIHSK
jgi:tRNA pseudouridine38-40 synthase